MLRELYVAASGTVMSAVPARVVVVPVTAAANPEGDGM